MKTQLQNQNYVDLPLADAVVLSTDKATFTLNPCGPLDALALGDFCDAHFKNDYFFKRSHWRELLADSKYQVFAISQLECEQPCLLILCGIIVTYQHSRLTNLYIKPELRRSGLGSMILEALAPDEIRAKTDWSEGDPTEFYQRQGYTIIQSKTGRKSNITVLRRTPQTYQPPLTNHPIPNAKRDRLFDQRDN